MTLPPGPSAKTLWGSAAESSNRVLVSTIQAAIDAWDWDSVGEIVDQAHGQGLGALHAAPGEDEVERAEKELENITKAHTDKIDEALKNKEAELLEV